MSVTDNRRCFETPLHNRDIGSRDWLCPNCNKRHLPFRTAATTAVALSVTPKLWISFAAYVTPVISDCFVAKNSRRGPSSPVPSAASI
jgi:hypothetical protein